MAEPLRCIPSESLVTGWDFSTGAVKCLAFDLDGRTLTVNEARPKPAYSGGGFGGGNGNGRSRSEPRW